MLVTKKIKSPTIFIVIILTMVLFTATVFAINPYVTTKNLNVPRIDQNAPNWCWAACTEMALAYYGIYVPQAQIVSYIHGDPVNEPGSVFDIQDALDHWGVNSVASYYSKSFSTIKYEIDAGRPMIVGRVGHAEVISGYYQDISDGTQDVFYINPYDASFNFLDYSTFEYYWNGGTVYYI